MVETELEEDDCLEEDDDDDVWPKRLCTGKSWRLNTSSAFILDKVLSLAGGEAFRFTDFFVVCNFEAENIKQNISKLFMF